jgi:hypothetical protein
MTFFLWAVLAVTCAALMVALAAFDRLIEIGSAAFIGFVSFGAGVFLHI